MKIKKRHMKHRAHKIYRGYHKTEEVLKFIIIVAISLAIITTIYYFFLYTRVCQDQACFSEALLKCKKTKWINDAEEATWLYTIKGASNGKCEIEVKLLIVKEGRIEISEVEGKTMSCYLPFNVVKNPEQDLARCTGPLKEDLQNLIIKRMHSYILENLGEISEELIKPL